MKYEFNQESEFWDYEFLIPKGLDHKSVMNASKILNESIFQIEFHIERFKGVSTNPNDFLPEERERYYLLKKLLIEEKRELQQLKMAYAEYFI